MYTVYCCHYDGYFQGYALLLCVLSVQQFYICDTEQE